MEALNVENATETPQEEVYHHKSSLPLLTLGAIGVVFGPFNLFFFISRVAPMPRFLTIETPRFFKFPSIL